MQRICEASAKIEEILHEAERNVNILGDFKVVWEKEPAVSRREGWRTFRISRVIRSVDTECGFFFQTISAALFGMEIREVFGQILEKRMPNMTNRHFE